MKMKSILWGFALLLGVTAVAQDDLEDGLYANVKTNKGDILIALEYEKAPLTVANFVGLAEGKLKYGDVKIKEPFFDSLKFHRVIDNFMIQGGDPEGNGSGNPGYRFPDEFDSTLLHDRAGTLSMANSGPNTNGSQFFITHKDTPWLNGKHAVFGYVVDGQDVVNSVRQNDIILTVEIIRVGKPARKFKAHKVFVKRIEELEEIERAKNEERNKKFRAQIGDQFADAEMTDSGLMYEIIESGSGIQPETGDTVQVHYTGMFLDGKVFDTSLKRGKPYPVIIDQSRVIKGWHEGLKLGDYGGKIKIVLPHWLAYGKMGRGSIPPNATLVFDLELMEKDSEVKK